jgi:ribosomal-protein-alanine N-acetyltransferase
VIETARLLLRVPEDADAEPWRAMLADPEVARYLGPPRESREAVVAYIETVRERHAADGFGALAVVRRADSRVVGRSGFFVRDTRTWSTATLRVAGDHAEVEVGWALARDCWGSGYATEAAEACRDHGFARLGLQRIIALILAGNERSMAVARRLGMQHERDVHGPGGVDSHIFAVTRAEWQESLGSR